MIVTEFQEKDILSCENGYVSRQRIGITACALRRHGCARPKTGENRRNGTPKQHDHMPHCRNDGIDHRIKRACLCRTPLIPVKDNKDSSRENPASNPGLSNNRFRSWLASRYTI
jgi:hypothetical protein